MKIAFEVLEVYMMLMLPIFLITGGKGAGVVHQFNLRMLKGIFITPGKLVFKGLRALHALGVTRAVFISAPVAIARGVLALFRSSRRKSVTSTARVAPVADVVPQCRSSSRVVQFRRPQTAAENPVAKPATSPVPEQHLKYADSDIPPELDPSSGFQVVMEARRRRSDNDDHFIH